MWLRNNFSRTLQCYSIVKKERKERMKERRAQRARENENKAAAT